MNFQRISGCDYISEKIGIETDQIPVAELLFAAGEKTAGKISETSELSGIETAIATAESAAQKASEAVRLVNAQIEFTTALDASHATQVRELIQTAMAPGSTATAVSMQRAAKSLREERLAALLRAAKIPELKKQAQAAIRESARARVPIYEKMAAFHEEQASLAADLLGLAPDCVQRTTMIRTNPDRNRSLQRLSQARRDSGNYRVEGHEEDAAAMDALKKKIAEMLS